MLTMLKMKRIYTGTAAAAALLGTVALVSAQQVPDKGREPSMRDTPDKGSQAKPPAPGAQQQPGSEQPKADGPGLDRPKGVERPDKDRPKGADRPDKDRPKG